MIVSPASSKVMPLSRNLGVSPELRCCVSCGKQNPEGGFRQFSVSAGGIICDDCANKEKTDPNALIYKPSFAIIDVFRYFQSKPLKTFEKVTLKRDVSGMIRRILAEYTQRYLDVDVLSGTGELEA